MRSRAFTMLELTATAVVLLIIVGMGFIGTRSVQNKTTATVAKTELTQVAQVLQSLYESRGYYPTDKAEISAVEGGLVVTAGALSVAGVVSLAVTIEGEDDVLGLAALDKSGQCIALRVGPIDSLVARRSSVFKPTPALPCSGMTALTIVGASW